MGTLSGEATLSLSFFPFFSGVQLIEEKSELVGQPENANFLAYQTKIPAVSGVEKSFLTCETEFVLFLVVLENAIFSGAGKFYF